MATQQTSVTQNNEKTNVTCNQLRTYTSIKRMIKLYAIAPQHNDKSNKRKSNTIIIINKPKKKKKQPTKHKSLKKNQTLKSKTP